MDKGVLKQIICDKFLDGDQGFPLEGDTDLLADGICDSLSLVQIAVELEERVPGLTIADQDVTRENFSSIDAILRYLASKAG